MGCIVRTNYQLKFRVALKNDRKDTVPLEYLSSSNTYYIIQTKDVINSIATVTKYIARTDGAKILSMGTLKSVC